MPNDQPPSPRPFDEGALPAIGATLKLLREWQSTANEAGLPMAPATEAVALPNPKDYLVPDHLSRTAPDLVSELRLLLDGLRELNHRHLGRNTNETESYLSLTGEHEPLEQLFYRWTKAYFGRRGSLDRLNPRVKNDPCLLYEECLSEFNRVLGGLNALEQSVNMAVLNLSFQHVEYELANQMLRADVSNYQRGLQHRFSSEHSAQGAESRVQESEGWRLRYARFLAEISLHLPPEFAPTLELEWETKIRHRIKLRGEELELLRFALGDHKVDATSPCQLAPKIWARCAWDVFMGGSVLMVQTAEAPDKLGGNTTEHPVSFRRDGRLCCRLLPWVQVDPDAYTDPDVRQNVLAVNLFVLDTLTEPIYQAWSDLDIEPIARRGVSENATEHDQDAALAVVMAAASEDILDEDETFGPEPTTRPQDVGGLKERPRATAKGRTVGVFRLRKLIHLLRKHFGCEWSQGVGSEIKVRRGDSHYFSLGCHGTGQVVLPYKVRDCLARLNIPLEAFKLVCR